MMYVIAANLTNKTFLAGIEPLYDVLQGNPSATARWTASFGSSLYRVVDLEMNYLD